MRLSLAFVLVARVLEAAAETDNTEHCPHDNLLRCLIRSPTLAYTFCSWSVDIYPTPVTVYSTVKVSATPTIPTLTATSSTTVQTVTVDHTQTTTVSYTTSIINNITTSTTTTLTVPSTPPTPPWFFRASPPKTSLACLDDLEPMPTRITSACACFASSQATPTVTSTVTWTQGEPTCADGQPTFPDCFADFHPYNCGTDHAGQIACSCAQTTEDTAACTLGDYERDNACGSSDDCAEGWLCTVIDCFGDGVPSICTKACPVVFAESSESSVLSNVGNHRYRNLSVVIGSKL